MEEDKGPTLTPEDNGTKKEKIKLGLADIKFMLDTLEKHKDHVSEFAKKLTIPEIVVLLSFLGTVFHVQNPYFLPVYEDFFRVFLSFYPAMLKEIKKEMQEKGMEVPDILMIFPSPGDFSTFSIDQKSSKMVN